MRRFWLTNCDVILQKSNGKYIAFDEHLVYREIINSKTFKRNINLATDALFEKIEKNEKNLILVHSFVPIKQNQIKNFKSELVELIEKFVNNSQEPSLGGVEIIIGGMPFGNVSDSGEL